MKPQTKTFTIRDGDQLLINGVLHRVRRTKGRGNRLELAIPNGVAVKRVPRTAIDKTGSRIQK